MAARVMAARDGVVVAFALAFAFVNGAVPVDADPASGIAPGPTAAAAVGTAQASAPAESAQVSAPVGTAFYVPPAPLPAGAHGEVIWSRPFTGASAFPDAASNTLVLYHETTVTGRDVAVTGTVSIPRGTPPDGGWPVISWAHGTTGNAPQCAPSREPSNPKNDADDQAFFDGFLRRGYAIVATDYEGQGVTDPVHPYFVGLASARDVTDMVRAARSLYPQLSSRWFVLGHSEGGAAAIFTAALGAGYAPELTLMGSVSYAPATFLAGFLQGTVENDRPSEMLVFALEMIQGIASSDPAIDLKALLSDEAARRLPVLQQRCSDDLMADSRFVSLPGSSVFRPGADLGPLRADFNRNEPSRVALRVPLLVMQGTSDEVVSPDATRVAVTSLCRAPGARVLFVPVAGKTHLTIVTQTFDTVVTWLDAVRTGATPASSCGDAGFR